jgi:heptaprenyl diphosphate synthase
MKESSSCGILFRSSDLFITGLLMMAAFLANPSTPLRTAQFLIFWFYALLMGKKTNPLVTLLVMLGVVVCNLLVPYGKIIAEMGVFRITQGSLFGGIRKAVTLEGLIMLSKASVHSNLRLPGAFGSLLGEALWIFQRIMNMKEGIRGKDFIYEIDRLMLKLSEEQESMSGQIPVEPPRTAAALVILAGAIALVLALTAAALTIPLSPF